MTTRGAVPRVRVRKGRLADLDQIREFTHDTFSWGDYLPGAWAGWARSKRGVLLVASCGAQIVGTCHLRLLEHREGWLEGVRVRHAFRKQGVASILIQAARALARENKCRVVRLETGSHNLAAQGAFEKFGYHYVTRYAGFAATALDQDIGKVRLAEPSDLGLCWAQWEKSWLKRASEDIVPAPYGWRWWELTRTRLGDEIRNGGIWITGKAFMGVRVEDGAFDIILLAGLKRDAQKLLDTARVLAKRQNLKRAYWVTPHVAVATRWATEAGYTLDEDGLLIYACAL